ITLAPGRVQRVQVIGPDGRPVSGTRVSSLQPLKSLASKPLAGSEFTFVHANPGKAETVVILQTDRSLAACVDLKGDEPDPIRVALQPAGTITGRLVDEAGHFRPSVGLAIMQHFHSRGGSISAERF